MLRYLADRPRTPTARGVASLSFLRRPGGWLIFSLYVYFRNAGLWAGMVRRCVPCIFEQLLLAEFLAQYRASLPVS